MEKIDFINNQQPALNATNLNKIQDNTEDAIQEVQDVADDLDTNKLDKTSVKDAYSTSTTYTYSCNYVNGLETYSTDETRVGTWIDGKPIYRKVLTGTLPTGSGENTFNFSGISIINFYGKIKATSGASFLINTYYTPLPAYSISGWLDSNGNLKIECGTNYRTTSEYNITIEYTKTND